LVELEIDVLWGLARGKIAAGWLRHMTIYQRDLVIRRNEWS
jgi:hypothetical protein